MTRKLLVLTAFGMSIHRLTCHLYVSCNVSDEFVKIFVSFIKTMSENVDNIISSSDDLVL